MSYLTQDVAANRGHTKIVFIMVFFRLVNLFARKRGSVLWWLGIPFMILYRFIVEYILCVELRASTQVGSGFKIEHGYALVINDHTKIGNNVHVRHCTTIGCVKLPDGTQGPSPIIEDDVEIGANVCIIGGIHIGRGAVIGAGAVVTKDVPSGAVMVGNPARMVRRNETSSERVLQNTEVT